MSQIHLALAVDDQATEVIAKLRAQLESYRAEALLRDLLERVTTAPQRVHPEEPI